MQDIVNGEREAFHPLSELTGSEIRGYQPGKFFQLAASQSPSKNCRAAAVGKNATRPLNRSNSPNFGVSRKRFKPSTPASTPSYHIDFILVYLFHIYDIRITNVALNS